MQRLDGSTVSRSIAWVLPGLLALPVVLAGLWAAEAGAVGPITETHGDDDILVSIEDASAEEGRYVEFRVIVSEVRTVPLQVEWALEAGTALERVDFNPVRGGELEIPAGATEGTIRIRTIEDDVAEPDDVFTVSLVDVTPIPPDGAFLSETAKTAEGTILNDDGDLVVPDQALLRALNYELGRRSVEAVTADELASLTRLVDGQGGIRELTGIEFAVNLDTVWLGRGEVRDLTPLSHVPGLTSLRISSGLVRDLAPLAGLTGLKELDLSNQLIANIDPLRHLVRLEFLDLPNNYIGDLEPLEGLRNLGRLVLEGNMITDLAPLREMTGLWLLVLDGNSISNVAPLRGLTGLRRLDLADNSISDIAPLAPLSALTTLNLARNAISDLGPVLESERFLRYLDLYVHGNPLTLESRESHIPEMRGKQAKVFDVGVSITDTSAWEGRPLTFKVHLSAPVSEPVNLEWLVNPVPWSTDGVDYIRPLLQRTGLTVPSRETEATFEVETLADDEDEAHEPVLVELWDSPEGLPLGVAMGSLNLPMETYGLILEPGAPVRQIPFMGSGGHEMRQGLMRVINHFRETPTTVHMEAFDDAGNAPEPITLAIGQGMARQFISRDLEAGSLAKGLSGGVGDGSGGWRLRLQSNEFEALAYMRTDDGLLTSMHDVIPLTSVGYFVPIFNPARNPNQVSWLRLSNAGETSASVRITGVDDTGVTRGNEISFRLAGGESRALSTSDLESGTGLNGALGRGSGKWRLFVASNVRIHVMNLLESPTGHLSNLSTLAKGHSSGEGSSSVYRAPLFPSAADAKGREGFVRVINHGDEKAEITVSAKDDTRWVYDPVTLTVGPGAAAQFNSHDLESGNADKGLPVGVGAGEGDWRLELESEQDIDVGAYIRTEDGFLTSMHDVVPCTEDGCFVPTFNPARNTRQVSQLRLINPTTQSAEVRVRAIDDRGGSPGDDVLLYVSRDSARTVSAGVLEEGLRRVIGKIGRGYGKWRLMVSSNRPVEVVNLMETPTGHLVNLSTRPTVDRR
ncbi:MAG: hypothetical protein OXQ29_23640 [Rhodospirillaceae bacterium]|nr:hypothetical protein [Rhodospirillaceae bacterium]